MCETLAELLEMIGYHVLTAADGAAARILYAQQPNAIALVITDLTMPEMNGIELTNALHQLNQQVKVIIATGYQPDFVTKGQIRSGAVIWLQKPIDIDRLQHTIGQLLQTV